MPITFHPPQGAIVLCDFQTGFKVPEMVKRRPVVIISPPISVRGRLCTIVPLSTEPPNPVMPYHHQLTNLQPNLPAPYDTGPNWLKGDMIVSVSFDRLELFRYGKDRYGDRVYRLESLPPDDWKIVQGCVLSGLGFASLKKYL
jgi:mRNA interferase MazF